jgi:hypothetical protein
LTPSSFVWIPLFRLIQDDGKLGGAAFGRKILGILECAGRDMRSRKPELSVNQLHCKGSTFCPTYRPNTTSLAIHLSPFTTSVQTPRYSPTLRYIFAYSKTLTKLLIAEQQGIFAM